MELVHLTSDEYMKAAQFDKVCFDDADIHEALKPWKPEDYRVFFGLDPHEDPEYVKQIPLARATLAVNEHHEEVGFAAWYTPVDDEYRPEKVVTYLSRFGILPHQRRKGYGRTFFELLCEHAAPTDQGYIYLHSHRTNPNYDFWKDIGCDYVGESTIDNKQYDAYEKYF